MMVKKLSPYAVILVAFGIGAILDACDHEAEATVKAANARTVHVAAQKAPDFHRDGR